MFPTFQYGGNRKKALFFQYLVNSALPKYFDEISIFLYT
jgi:hypothetical protein